MKFLIQENSMNREQLYSIHEAVKDFPFGFVKVLPFDDKITSDFPIEGKDWIPYGSTSFTNISAEKGFKGLHYDLSKMNYSECVKNRDDMLNEGFIGTIEQALIYLEDNFPDDLFFVRPSEDTKQFAGYVDNVKNIIRHLEYMVECQSEGTYSMSKDDMIVLSEPRIIQMEWRYFIIGGKIIDGSIYRSRGNLYKEHETDRDVLEEAQSLADRWLPDQCCVMDVALVDDELKVIEFNCINSSGFYDHDVDKIFKEWYEYEVKHANN